MSDRMRHAGGEKLHRCQGAAFNVAALFVISATIITPLTPAFAQTSTASGTPSPDSLPTMGEISSDTVTGSSSVAPDQTATPTASGNSSALPTPSPTPTPAESATPSPSTPAPTPAAAPSFTPGAQTGPDIQPVVYNAFNQNQVKIDKNTGALSTSYPLDIPPGRNGVQPNVSLVYNSQNTQQGSILGEGWSLSIPYIERLNKSGVDNLYSTSTLNYFTSSLDGELIATTTVTSTATGYVARTENGTFNKYTFSSSTNQWTMTDKNGMQYAFGSASDSQQSDPNNSAHVYKWMLKTVTDTNSNTVTYNYFRDSGQIYPSSTVYTGNGSSTGIFEVDFLLASTTFIDNATSSATGFAVNTNYRVNEVDAKVNGTWVRKYSLGYTTGDNGYTTLLGSIAESGQNASGTVVSLPSSTFNYQVQSPGWMSSSTWNPPVPFVSSNNADTGYRLADVLGNGRADIISSSSAWIDTGSGWVSSSTWAAPVNFSTNGTDSGYRVVNVRNNGLPAIVSNTGAWVDSGNGWTSSSTWTSPVAFASGGVNTGAIVADVNGDGLPDILPASSSQSFQVDASSTLTTSLVSYYKMEDPSDSWGGNNLTNNNSVGFVTGKVNNAGSFNGTSSSLSYANQISTSTDNFSVFAWVNIPTASEQGPFVKNGGDSGHSNGWLIGVGGTNYENSGNHLVAHYSGVRTIDFGSNIGTGWHLVGMIRKSGTLYGYIDSATTTNSFTDNPLTPNGLFEIGGSHLNQNDWWRDKIDEAGVWNKALSKQEIANLYNSGNGQTMVSNGPNGTAYINTGHGWATSTLWALPLPFVANGGIDVGTRIADVNGDGLADFIQGYTDGNGTPHYAAYLNTGTGWATSTLWTPPAPFIANGGWDNGVRIVDVNGDGLPDFVTGYSDVSGNPSSTAYLNTGHGWTLDNAWSPPTIFSSNGGYDQGARIADVLGNGLSGVLSGYTDFSGTNHYAAWTNNNAIHADLLTSITYPQGGNSAIQYIAAAQSVNASGTSTNYIPYPVYVVSKITTSDGAGNTASALSYQYSGGTYNYNGPYDHQFAGFSSVTQTDAAGNVTKTYYDTSNGNSTSTGQYQDNFWKIGKPFRVEQYDNANDLYKVTVTKWNCSSTGGNAAFVFPDQMLEMDYDGTSTHKDLAEAYTFSTSTGNQTQKIQWGQVTGNNDGSFTDTGSDELITNNTYASSSSSNVIGKLSDEVLTNQSSTKIQETQYFYDSLALGSVGKGNLTKQQDWKSGGTYVNIAQNTVNTYGLVTQALDPRNNTTTYAYDAYNLYPATTTNPLNQTSSYQYDYSTGKQTQTVDPNQLTFKTIYDGVGRVLQVLQPDQVTTSTLDTKVAYTYTDTANAVTVHESDYLTATTTVDTYSYYDGLNRLIQTRKSATDAGIYKVSDRAYNTIGSVQRQSLPYFAASSTKAVATTTAVLFAVYAYDPLGRVLTVGNAVGTTTNTYVNWKITTTDPNGNIKDTYDDAYGNLIQVGEHNGTSTYTTTYTYDGLKDLLTLTDANSNVRNFVYDGLGRMVSSTDLHIPTSSTYGIWNYTYDNAGNVTTKVDPKSQSITYGYDNLNRVTSESLGGTTQIAYTYDSCANGVGHLCTVSSTDAVAQITRTYDPEGNLASETKKIDGTNYLTTYTYDRQGNQLTITNPDNSIVQYAFGTGGLVTSVQEKEPSSSFVALVSSIDYSPMDKITTQTDANGVTTVNTYDSTRLYRLNNTVTTDNGSGFGPMAPMGGGGFGPLAPPPSGGSTFGCTGAETSYTVPAGVTKLLITAFGAQGGASGGLGGEVSGTLAVTPSTTYYINVGCQNGYDGGGAGGVGNNGGGGTGGGMTWLSANANFGPTTVLLIAGGGGGGGGQGDDVGTGSPGAGGIGGGLTGNGGGMGSSAYCSSNECAGGGGPGTQVGPGAGGTPAGNQAYVGVVGGIGYGGYGGNANYLGGGGGGGGGGYYGGGGGAGNGYDAGGYMGGGGGGGSSFIAATSFFSATSTTAGVNSGDGSLTITAITPLTNLNQYVLNTTTTLNEGSSTNTGLTFGATMNSNGSSTLQLQIEVEPTGTVFTNLPNATSSIFVSPGTAVSTTFTGITGGYHWQARQMNASGTATTWQAFGPSATSTDFVLSSTIINAPQVFSALNQYRSDGITAINIGSSTNRVPVVLSATLNAWIGSNLQLQAEVEPSGTAFTNTPNVATSTFVVSGVATTTFAGANGSYHWQARTIDAQNNTSTWQIFGSTQTGPKGFQVDASGTLTTNLVSYYKLENASDTWGANTLTNNNSVSFVTGKVNNAASFNGTSNYLSTSTQISTSTNNFSVFLWVNIPTASEQGPFVKNGGSSGSSNGWLIGVGSSSYEDAGNHLVAHYSGVRTINFGTNIGTGWHLVGMIRTGGTLYGYIDTATSTNSFTDNPLSPSGPFEIGASHLNVNDWWRDKIDEVGVWNKALSKQEITNLYNSGNGQTMVAATIAPSTTFVLAVPHINFTFPAQGTTTLNFANWQLKADTVTSTDSYSLTVNWDDTTGDPAQSSTINASGTQLLAGVNVPKPTSSLDYTYDGTPVLMNATATLYDATTTSATSSVSFTEQTTVAPLNCGSHQVQCVAYTYDSDGNVTQVTDNSATNAAITVNYAYDSLNRLISASSSNAASGQNYLQTFSYDKVGNILSGPQGTYSYNGASNTNPDAVTKIVNGTSTTQFTYDNNGNLTNASSGFAYTWDYANHLLKASSSNNSSTYGYDYTGERMKIVNGTSTIYDPETTYSVTSVTPTKNIFVNGQLVATITGTGVSSTAYTNLTDFLGGSNVVLGTNGTTTEVMSYYPYGAVRVDQQPGSFNQRRKYIGQIYDGQTQLSYLNARYYNGSQGQFLSQDPMFLGNQSQQNLADPQSVNPYSYSEDNPIVKSDPSGKFVFIPALIAVGVGLVLPQSAGGDMDANGNLVPVGGLSNTDIYGTTAVIAGGSQAVSAVAGAFTFRQIAAGVIGVVTVLNKLESIVNFFTLNGDPLSGDGSVTNATEMKKIKVTSPQPLQWTSGSPIITSAPPNGAAIQVGVGNQGGGGRSTGGGSSSAGSSGGDPRYSFSGGKNIYGQTIQDVFPSYTGKVGSK